MEIVIYGEEKVSSVTEARTIDQAVTVTYRKEKSTLPYNRNERLKGSMVYFVNTSLDGIVSILNNNHRIISNISKLYNTYFYDYSILRGSLECDRLGPIKGIRTEDAKRQRIERYTAIKNKMEGIITPLNIDRALNRNLVYDLEPVINYLKGIDRLTNLPIKVRLKAYFDTLYKFYKKEYKNYTTYGILVNLDEFSNDCTLDDYHALLYVLTAFTRSESSMDELRHPMVFTFYTDKGYVVFNLEADLTKKNLSKFRNAIKRLKPSYIENIEEKAITAQIVNNFNVKMGFTGNVKIPEDDEEVGEILQKSIKEELDEDDENNDTPADEAELADDIDTEIENDEELKRVVMTAITKNKSANASKASLARDKLLRERQKDIIVKNKTIGELTAQIDIPDIKKEKFDVSEVMNNEIAEVKFDNFESTYNETMLERDIASAITIFNDKTISANVTDVQVKDTSDILTYKDTYTIHLEDENRNRHTIHINVPKFIDDRFLYIGGNRRIIKKQFAGLPVIKTAPDTVQMCSSAYNKIFITRGGTRFNPNMERLKKIIDDPSYKIKFLRGCNDSANSGKLTCLEYDELASTYTEITIGVSHYVFNVEMLENSLDNKYKSELGKYLIGYKDDNGSKTPIWYDQNNEDNEDMISTMIHNGNSNMYDDFKSKSFGKRYVYTTATLMKKHIPTVVLICFFEGLTTVMNKFEALYGKNVLEIVSKKSNKDNFIYIPFEDCYLRYPMSCMEACILFNGFTRINTTQYSLADMDTRETYIDIFEALFGSAYVIGGLLNCYDFFIDPITLEVIRTLNLPEDFVSLTIYANNLLSDNQYITDIGLENYRLRDNEIIPAIMYKELTKAYSTYRKTQNSKTPSKLSVNPDCIIQALNEIPTVTDYSRLSPILEYREMHIASMSGFIGMNVDDAYTIKKRSFDKSMTGVIGVSTDTAGNAGRERHLVIEPNVENARGMIRVVDDKERNNMDYTKYMTGVEALVPGGLRHDIEKRTAMAVKQKGHMIPIASSSPLLITNGFDSMIHYRTSDDFSVVAKEDGEVIDCDENAKIMIIQYKSGKRKAIDLSQKQVKNGGGGMYLRNQLVSSFKKGDKFKKGAIVAYDKYFYKDMGPFGNRLCIGTLVKSAIISHSSTYEDSTWFTSKISREMGADISMPHQVIIGKNATVGSIVKVGQEVKVGDPLIEYETSYDKDELNKLLSNIRSDLHEEIVNLGKSRITSHYAGVVDDIVVYSSVDIDELSPSLKHIAEESFKANKAKRKAINKHDTESSKDGVFKMGLILDRPEGKVEPDKYGKIAGMDVVDSVLIRFYVTYHDELSDGDKLLHMTANKGTCGYKIPEGYEPRTPFRPYEEISIPVSSSAVLQRGTPSISTDMAAYKLIIEAKRKMYEILTGEDWNEKAKRENPEMVLTGDFVSESVDYVSNNHLVSNKKLLSETMYTPGDAIFVGEEATRVYQFLKENDAWASYKQPNVRYDSVEEVIYATDLLYPQEVMRVSF